MPGVVLAAMFSRVEGTHADRPDVPRRSSRLASVGPGLLSALTWGLVAPIVAAYASGMPALLAAGGMDFSAGFALSVYRLLRSRRGAPLSRSDVPRVAAITFFGAVLAPYAMVRGLATAPANLASLLLNLELVFSIGIAILVLREPATWRRLVGGALVAIGGALVTKSGASGVDALEGGAWIALASLAWAIDTNLTRGLAERDPVTVARAKLLAGGATSLALGAVTESLAAASGSAWLAVSVAGAVGIGLSLALFIVSLRRVGVTTTSVLFGTGPFLGALVSTLLLHEPWTWHASVSAAAMAAGVLLVATEVAPPHAPVR